MLVCVLYLQYPSLFRLFSMIRLVFVWSTSIIYPVSTSAISHSKPNGRAHCWWDHYEKWWISPSSQSPSVSHCCFASCSISMASAALGHCPMRSGCSFRINERKACCTKEISWASTVSPKMPLALKTCITNRQIWWMRKVFQRCQLFQQKNVELIQENVSEIVFSLFSCQDLTFDDLCIHAFQVEFLKIGCPKSPWGSILLDISSHASEQNLLCFSGKIRAISWDASSRRRCRAASSAGNPLK